MDISASPPRYQPTAHEQLAIVGALYRFGADQDLRDGALLESRLYGDLSVLFPTSGDQL